MADHRLYVQGQNYQLYGAGIGLTDVSIKLASCALPTSGTLVTMAMFGTVGYGTLEPETDREENISFTGITQNGDGSATLTGVTRGLDLVSPYTQDLTLRRSHAGSTIFRFTNTVQFYDNFANKLNDEDITGQSWTIDDPVLPREIANKEYVDNIAITGAPAASTTLPGIVIEATQAQVDAKTTSTTYLGNPYELFVNPGTMRSTKYNDYVVDTGAVNAYAIAPSPAITAYVAGQQFTFKVTNTNTGASTLAVNGLAATPIKKQVSVALVGGELLAGQVVSVVYDGTNFQITSTPPPSVYSFGQTSKAAGTGSVNITHGLGQIPKLFKVTYFTADTSGSASTTIGSGAATGTGTLSCTYNYSISSNSNTYAQSTTNIIQNKNGAGITIWQGTLTAFNSTTITILLTDNVGTGATVYIQWEAFA